ncbi:MAG: MFS transporter [Chloroflexi bacterium]|uniref:MFS transporter n=1 Tax=Candidatus Chlorohelix allophototropha TaxID=3003348 RepID=A0A8T7M8B4_9CHLR|nr:MFS transporter [Chloroflexota bacterium]WJW68331.1 MFS transporter [Chloroflexota bacterium L227-S17]
MSSGLLDSPIESKIAPVNLWHNRNFNIFWVGQTINSLGDSFAFIALPLLVLQATGSIAQMGLVTGIFGLGQLLANLVAGLVVDRVNRRKLMIMCDIGQALVYILVPIGWWLIGTQIWLIYLLTFTGAILSAFFQVAYITAVAGLVEREQVTEANGRLQVTVGICYVAGPMLAGLISAIFGPVVALGLDSISFLLSANSLWLVRWQIQPQPEEENKPNIWNEWLNGAKFLFRQPVLRAVALLLAVNSLISTAGLDLFIFYLKTPLKQSDDTVGLVLGVASIGAIASGIWVASLRRKFGFGACWLGGMALGSISIGLIGFAQGIILISILSIFYMFGNMISGISSMSLRQQITPNHMLGRVTAFFWFFMRVPGMFGAAITTAIAEFTGVTFMLIAMGVVGLGISALGLLTPARQRYPERYYEN